MRRNGSYSKLKKEDPDETRHRRAQFLIYKVMEEADVVVRRRSSKGCLLRVKLCRLKVKIGKRLKRFRKCVGVKIMSPFRQLKRLFSSDNTSSMPSLSLF